MGSLQETGKALSALKQRHQINPINKERVCVEAESISGLADW